MAKEKPTVQRECVESITSWGGYAYKVRDGVVCPRCGEKIVPPVGRADYFCTLGTYGFVVEVKAGETRFDFSQLSEDQRSWAEWYWYDRYGDWLLWLSLGKRLGGKKYPRKTWLIPYDHYINIEGYIAENRKSIPYDAACEHFADWELEHDDNGWLKPDWIKRL